MKKIAVLITCYNRQDKTVKCLSKLYQAASSTKHKVYIDVYLTDDGDDNTSEIVSTLFPTVTILKGDGTLFWAGGMRNSWKEAQKKKYDGYLLLNDDTNVMDNLFDELINTHNFCIENYGLSGIYIGSTIDSSTHKLTYGGAILKNKFLNTSTILIPNGKVQSCDLGNGNIMLVSDSVFKKIGMLSEKYKHNIADYDYTLRAKKNRIPVLLTGNYSGECSNDHINKYERFQLMDISQRIKFINSPLGFAFPDTLKYMKENFPYRWPFVFISGWFKVFFPTIYIQINKLRYKK
jgi:GT2 family glycosyltransferase